MLFCLISTDLLHYIIWLLDCAIIISKPVCCDGVEYPNDCHALNANADFPRSCKSGTCEEPCVCPMTYSPVVCGMRRILFNHFNLFLYEKRPESS